MKKHIGLFILLLVIICGCEIESDTDDNPLFLLQGKWIVELSESTFDFGSPPNVNDYVYLQFEVEGEVLNIHILDADGVAFETNRIDSIEGGAGPTSGAFNTTMTMYTPDPESFEGSSNYWTYLVEGSKIIIDVFDDETMAVRFVRFTAYQRHVAVGYDLFNLDPMLKVGPDGKLHPSFEYDLVKLIAERNNFDLSFVLIDTTGQDFWTAMRDALNAEAVDALFGFISVSAERQTEALFSIPHISGYEYYFGEYHAVDDSIAFVFRLTDTQLKAEFDDAIQAFLDDGTIAELRAQYGVIDGLDYLN